MIYDDVSGLVRVLVVGTLAYASLVVLLRISGKRTLAQLNAFDFIVTVALGSTLATIVLSGTVAWAEGALTLALLAALQFVVARLTVRFPWVRRALTSEPTLLVRHGQLVPAALGRERIAEESLHQSIRSAGAGSLDLVAAVVVETNGTLSVITRDQLGNGSALAGVAGWPEGDRSDEMPSPGDPTTS